MHCVLLHTKTAKHHGCNEFLNSVAGAYYETTTFMYWQWKQCEPQCFAVLACNNVQTRYIHGALQSGYATMRNAQCSNSEDNLFWIRCINIFVWDMNTPYTTYIISSIDGSSLVQFFCRQISFVMVIALLQSSELILLSIIIKSALRSGGEISPSRNRSVGKKLNQAWSINTTYTQAPNLLSSTLSDKLINPNTYL